MNFFELLNSAVDRNRSLVCVGLDPAMAKLPECVRSKKQALKPYLCMTSRFLCLFPKAPRLKKKI